MRVQLTIRPCSITDLTYLIAMDVSLAGGNSSPPRPRWRKVAYGGMQSGYDDNHTDESFLEGMVMNASVVKRDILKTEIIKRLMGNSFKFKTERRVRI